MEVEKDLKPSSKSSKKLDIGLELSVLPIMFSNCLLYIDEGRGVSFGGISHHFMKEKTNIKK
jgi:hypothetical protein